MSTEQAAPPGGRWKTVHPVGPSSYSAIPTRRPGKSNRSSRLMADLLDFQLGDWSVQTAARAEPARPDGDIASDVSSRCNRQLGGELGVGRDQRAVDLQRLAAALLVESAEDERRQALAARPQLHRLVQRTLDQLFDVDAPRRPVGEQNAGAAGLPVAARDLRRFLYGLDALRNRRAALGVVEARQRVGPIAERRHTERLQHLRGRLDVQQ